MGFVLQPSRVPWQSSLRLESHSESSEDSRGKLRPKNKRVWGVTGCCKFLVYSGESIPATFEIDSASRSPSPSEVNSLVVRLGRNVLLDGLETFESWMRPQAIAQCHNMV